MTACKLGMLILMLKLILILIPIPMPIPIPIPILMLMPMLILFLFRFWQYSTYANSVQNCQQNKLKYRQSDARAYGFLEKFFCARSSFKPFVTPKPKNCFRLVVVSSSLPYIPFSRVASKRRSKNMTLQVSETKRNISDDWSLRQFYISFRFTRISLLSHLITI